MADLNFCATSMQDEARKRRFLFMHKVHMRCKVIHHYNASGRLLSFWGFRHICIYWILWQKRKIDATPKHHDMQEAAT